MSYRLPASDSSLRSLFDVRDLVAIGTKQVSPADFRNALSGARSFLANEPAAREVHSLCVKADGELILLRVGKRGGWKKLWSFGTL